MAGQTVTATIGQSIPNGQYRIETAGVGDQSTTLTADIAAYDTLAATVVSTLATLVADGASPTQAHVTAVNNAYTALKASYVTLKADTNSAAGYDFAVVINLAKVTSKNALVGAWRSVLRTIEGSGSVAAS